MSDNSRRVATAISAMYVGDAAASRWLNEFSTKDEAWAVALDLARLAPNPQIQFYAANMIYTKIKREFNVLSQENTLKLLRAVSETFAKCALTNEAFVRRMSLARASIALFAATKTQGRSVAEHVDQCVRMLNSPRWLQALYGLKSLPEELELLKESSDSPACLATTKGGGDAEEALWIFSRIVASVVASRDAYIAAAKQGRSDIARAFVTLVAACVEWDPEIWAAGGAPLGVDTARRLTELALECTANDDRSVGAIMLDAWLGLQDVEIDRRQPYMREPLFYRLLSVMIAQCAFRKDDGGDESEMDDDRNAAFRKGPPGCEDVVVSTFYLLQSQFLEQLRRGIAECLSVEHDSPSASAFSPRLVESALFLLSIAGREVVQRLDEIASAPPRNTAKGRRLAAVDMKHAKQLHATLHELFRVVLCDGRFASIPMLSRVALKFIGAYAPWIEQLRRAGAKTQPLVDSCIKFSANALGSPATYRQASCTVRTLCVQCKSDLVCNDVIALVRPRLDTLASSSAERSIIDARAAVGEGLADVIDHHTVQSSGIARAIEALRALCVPSLRRTSEATKAASSSSSSSSSNPRRIPPDRSVYGELVFLASIFAGSTRTGSCVAYATGDLGETKRAALRQLELDCWPVLADVANTFGSSADVVAALCVLYETFSLRLEGDVVKNGHLSDMVRQVVSLYSTMRISACLDYVATAVEVHGASSEEAARSFTNLLLQVCRVTLANGAASICQDPHLRYAFFQMLYRVYVHLPVALFSCPLFPQLVQVATGFVASDERRSSRAAIRWLENVVELLQPNVRVFRSVVSRCLSQPVCGRTLVRALVTGVVRSSSEAQFLQIGALLFVCCHAHGNVVIPWLADALKETRATYMNTSAPITDGDKSLFLNAAKSLSKRADKKRRFAAMVKTFCSVCRQKASATAMRAYIEAPCEVILIE
eukprot:g2506.t1